MPLELPWAEAAASSTRKSLVDLEYDAAENDPECRELLGPVGSEPSAMHVLDADWIRFERGTIPEEQILSGRGARPLADRRYVLLDEKGHLANIVVTGEDHSARFICYDFCPYHRTGAKYTQPPRRSSAGSVIAVGPYDGDASAARIRIESSPQAPDADWHDFLSIDLDGDTRADIVVADRRCGCHHVGIETRVRRGGEWIVSERRADLPLPIPPDWCDPALKE